MRRQAACTAAGSVRASNATTRGRPRSEIAISSSILLIASTLSACLANHPVSAAGDGASSGEKRMALILTNRAFVQGEVAKIRFARSEVKRRCHCELHHFARTHDAQKKKNATASMP